MFSYIIILTIVAISGSSAQCPSFGPDHPCGCKTLKDKSGEDFSILTCQNLQSESALQEVLVSAKGRTIFEFELIDCAFMYLPHDAFVGTTFEVLSIRNSSIFSLSDSNVAFEGLDNQLHLIEIVNCTYTSNWDWKQLSNLKHLMEILVSDSELIDITEDLSRIQNLDIEAFVFHRNNIQVLADNAFTPFVYLQRLTLDNNYITELKRSMFPNPARDLKILGLSYNRLETLPIDMFVNMPALRSLYLTGNPFYTIDEPVFRPIWKQVHLVLFYSTELSCDCRITWLTKEDNSRKFIHAECQGPANFKGRLVADLQPHELWC